MIKKVTDKKGFKMVGGKEVKMKSKKGVLTKKRLKTMKKRKAGGF